MRRALAFLLLMFAALPARAQEGLTIAVIAQERPPMARPANLEPPPADEGLAGARLAVSDNATTGRFLNQSFALDELVVPHDGDSAAAMAALAAKGHRLILSLLPAEALGKALPAAGEALVFNAGAPDDALRAAGCRPTLLHTLPDRMMLADALGQYLVKRNWRRWFLVMGRAAGDQEYAADIRRAAKRFGARIVGERQWTGQSDARRTAQAEVPVLTQMADYDVLVVADEANEFGDYLMYRTWDPRLVVGTQGLVATAWDGTVEQHGAVQLQNRFKDLAKRPMTARDYAAWVAVRSIGEAATRTRSLDPIVLQQYILAPDFALAAFKGRKLSFRPWDGQLRQPIPLAQPRALVSVSPQEGFLHPVTELDTLGRDRPESECRR